MLLKRGFTLVELSIVLVIIGLLIGGILVAQSMISASTINSQLRQLQQFDIAVMNFQTKYGGLPGDTKMPFIHEHCNGCQGNNDGIIDDDPIPNLFHAGNEFSRFWTQLFIDGPIIYRNDGCYYTGGPDPADCRLYGGIHAPWTKLSEKNVMVAAYGIHVLNKNFYSFVPTNIGRTDYVSYYSVTPLAMAAMDLKLDDGSPVTGKMVMRTQYSAIANTDIDTNSGCVNNNAHYLNGPYASSNTCLPRIEMMSQSSQ